MKCHSITYLLNNVIGLSDRKISQILNKAVTKLPADYFGRKFKVGSFKLNRTSRYCISTAGETYTLHFNGNTTALACPTTKRELLRNILISDDKGLKKIVCGLLEKEIEAA